MRILPRCFGKSGVFFKNALVFVFFLLAVPAFWGCDSGGNGHRAGSPAGETRAISGRVTGVDAEGGTMALLDASGNTIPVKSTGVDGDGSFRLEVDTAGLPESGGYVLRFTKNGKDLRSLVMAWSGKADYSGDEAVVSPFTEAAYLLCGLTASFNYSDYVAFLKAYTNGGYDFEAPAAYDFSFREIFGEMVAAVEDYASRTTAEKPDSATICDLLENQGHLLDTDLPPGQEDIRFIKRALVSDDCSGLVFIKYPPGDSDVAGMAPVGVSADSHQDGSLSWKAYTLDLGNGLLSSLEIRAAGFMELGPRDLPKLQAGPGETGVLLSGTHTFADATGQVRICSSNASRFIDIDACGLVSDATNTRAVFHVVFKEAVNSTGLAIRFIRMDGDGKNKVVLDQVNVTDEKVYKSPLLDLSDTDNQDRIIVAALVSGEDELYSMSDPVDVARYQASRPMIAMVEMDQTRADPSGAGIYNNFASSNDTNFMPVATGNVSTHYIVDLDRFLGTGVMPLWDSSTYGQAPIGDGSGRIPLITIHGWQGGFGLRDAARLSMWENSPVHDSCNFIEYYLTSRELQEAYHLYYARWPSYKHLEFSAGIFAGLLGDVKENRPHTDLAAGLSDKDIGVVLVTHSTGGLIARSAIESYLAFSDGEDKFAFLRRAVLMASPNHGTPVAVNTYIQDKLYDLDTQASGDLEWDSFDGNSNIEFDLLHRYDYLKDRGSRWNPDGQNLKAFDTHYLELLGDPGKKTYNPWLTWFNQAFRVFQDELKDKYILYSGWIRPDLLAWKQYNTMKNGPEMDAAGHYLSLTGYQNDAVLTVSSNLFAVDPGDKAFNPTDDSQIPTADWYPNSQVHFTQDWAALAPTTTPATVFGALQDHPRGMAFRLFWDYDHINLRAGAVDAMNTFGRFDAFLDMGDVIADDVEIPDIFLTEDLRRDYIRAALDFASGVDPGFINVKYNPLKFEPVFLCVEKDLMDLVP